MFKHQVMYIFGRQIEVISTNCVKIKKKDILTVFTSSQLSFADKVSVW